VASAVPTHAGTWLSGVLKNGKQYLYCVPVDTGKPVSSDACADLPKPCLAVIAGWTDDAVWVMAGPYDKKKYAWDHEAVAFRRYLIGETESSLDVPVSDAVPSAW